MSESQHSPNPFPGLRPFTQEEDYLFFGREEQTLELLERLSGHRFVAAVGTSGSGKSSLVRCGLLSELLGGKMRAAGAAWEIAVTHPGGNPLALLADALLDAGLYDREKENSRENLLATLSRSHFGLVEAVKQAGLPEGANFLLVVDQFEEIFRFHESGQTQQEAANEFVSLLLEATAQKDTPIYVVLTMRSDFIGECGQFEGLAEMVSRGEFLIPKLTRDQYRRIIEGPIKVAGGQIAPRLLQRLLNDLGQQADQLPCLQHALMRTWSVWAQNGDARALDLDDYQRIGKMAQALSLHADEIFDSLPTDNQRELCRRLFQALTVQESENRGIRRPQRLGRLCQILDVPADELVPIIDAYRRHGVTFLMPAPEVALTERTIIDISHESLMRIWARLRQWVDEEAQAAGIYLRLSESAALYRDGKAGLYRDPELGIALAWQQSQQPNAAWAERYNPGFAEAMSYLAASRQAGLVEDEAREAARQRELDQARQLAEVQQLRLEQQRRAARKLHKLVIGLAAVAVLAGLACIAALVANRRANTLADNARQNEDKANQNAIRAEQSQQETANLLTVVASQKEKVQGSLSKAEEAERLARAAVEEGRQLQYTTDMQLAPSLWRDDRTTAEQLRALLAKHIPDERMKKEGGTMNKSGQEVIPDPSSLLKTDRRGFEWYYYQHLLENSAAVFSGHEAPVVASAFSSNGRLVTLDQSGQVRRWDLNSQGEDAASRRDLPAGPSAQLRVLSLDGRLAAFAEGDKIHVLDTSTGKEIVQINSINVGQRHMIFSSNGDSLVIVDSQIRWCDAATGEVTASIDQTFNRINSLALSADGLTLAIVGHGPIGRQFSIFRLDATKRKATLLVKDIDCGATLGSSALSPDGKWIAVGFTLNGALSIFETTTGGSLARHGSAHASPISAMAISANGTMLATGEAQGAIKIWEAGTEKFNPALLTLKGHQRAVTTISFSNDGKRLVSSSTDKTARVWDLETTGAAIRQLENHVGSPAACFSPDRQLIAAAGGGRVRLWDAATGRLVRDLSAGDATRIYSVAFSPTDSRLLAVGHGGARISYVSLWDIDAGTELERFSGANDIPYFTFNENTGAVGVLAFSPDGKYLVAGFGSKTFFTATPSPNPLKVWEVDTRRLVHLLYGHTGFCVSLDFSKNGDLLASGSRDGTVILWSTTTWKPTRTLQNPDTDSQFGKSTRGNFEGVAFSPDGTILAAASREGTVQLWGVESGKLLKALKGHSSAVEAVVFSPNGRTLASGGADQTVRLWNVQTRRELMQLDPGVVGLGQVHTLAFSADGKQLLAGGSSRTAVWSTEPIVWNDPDKAVERLRLLLQSNADVKSRIRMLSEHLRLHEALEKLDSDDRRIQAALAAAQANWHASRQAWPEAVSAFDRLAAADPADPAGWLRTGGLLRVATALLHQDRPADAASLLEGGASRRIQDGLPTLVRNNPNGEQFFKLQTTVDERLTTTPRDAGLLELRAELAGQRQDFARQAADDTAAIDVLTAQAGEPPFAQLRRIYRRRGDAYVRLQKWAQAVDDYAHVITPGTIDVELLSKRASAHEALKNWQAAADNWSRAAAANPEGARLLARFAQRLAAAGQAPLADTVRDKARALFEEKSAKEPPNWTDAAELAQLYVDAGHTRDVIGLLTAQSCADPNDTELFMKVAALQAWFGQEKELDATRRRVLALAKTQDYPFTPNRTAKACCIVPLADKAQIDSALALGRVAVEMDKGRMTNQLALGMAEYRSGNFAAANEAMLAARRLSNNPREWVAGIAAFYRAMSLFRLGKADEARTVASAAAASMTPMPKDENNPMAGNVNHDALIMWLAYKEAKELIKFDTSSIKSLEQAREEQSKRFGDADASTLATTKSLADAYVSDGRTREAVPLLAALSAADPADTILSLKVAALQAWFGQDKQLADTRRRILAFAKLPPGQGTAIANTAERAAKVCSILPSFPKAELEEALALARKAVTVAKGGKYSEWYLLTLGMVEYRVGSYQAADQALLGAAGVAPNDTRITGTAAFYRAMSLFRQGKADEARMLASATALSMKPPLPVDMNNPGGNENDLILWLAYKEAKELIKFDAAGGAPERESLPAPKLKNEKK